MNSLDVNLNRVSAREILDALPDGAYITDCDRKILFWSCAAERITGWCSREVVGHSCSENILVHVDQDGNPLCGKEFCPLHRAIITDQQTVAPLLVFAQHKDGHRVPVQVSVAPLRDDSGQVLGGIEVFRDMTGTLQDLHRAKAIQDNALQSQIPPDPRVRFDVHYQPEELVGGDFYRVEQVSRDRYMVFIADVMGHGVASALYTMQLRSMCEEYRSLLDSPASFMTAISDRLHTLASAEGYFATAFYGVLDLRSRELVYIRAGHPAPFLLRASGEVRRLDARSPALGLRGHASFQQTTVALAKGDRVLMFTDGAVEITCKDCELLGEDGLEHIFRASADVDLQEVGRKLLEASSLIRLPDDLTLVRFTLL